MKYRLFIFLAIGRLLWETLYMFIFSRHSVSTNFRLEFIEPPASEVLIFWTLIEKEERGESEERRREHGSNLASLETAALY